MHAVAQHITKLGIYPSYMYSVQYLVVVLYWSVYHPSIIPSIPPDTSVSPQSTPDLTTLYEARVDIRKFSQFLQNQFNPTKVICSELIIMPDYISVASFPATDSTPQLFIAQSSFPDSTPQ